MEEATSSHLYKELWKLTYGLWEVKKGEEEGLEYQFYRSFLGEKERKQIQRKAQKEREREIEREREREEFFGNFYW